MNFIDYDILQLGDRPRENPALGDTKHTRASKLLVEHS